MSKIYQVRYTIGKAGGEGEEDKTVTVAHEHYTEQGAKKDAKLLSKAHSKAVVGEIETNDEDNSKILTRIWEFAGGEAGKAIPRNTPPSDVEVIKTAEETKLPDEPVKQKAPKKTDEERIAEAKAEAEATLKAISEGTYAIKPRGRKPSAEGVVKTKAPKKPKDEEEKVKKYMAELSCSEEAAKIIVGAHLLADSRRARLLLAAMNNNEGPVLLSQIVAANNENPDKKEDLDAKIVVSTLNHVNYLMLKHKVPWVVTMRERPGGDQRLNFVPISIEVKDDVEETEQQSAAE